MHCIQHSRIPGCSLVTLLVVGLILVTTAQAQNFSVIHTFTGGADGAEPQAGLTLDRAGNLYGTAFRGGNNQCGPPLGGGCGTVFRLMKKNSGWIFQPLHAFFGPGFNDGAFPAGRVTFGPDGALYGITENGGNAHSCLFGCGTVYKITPSASLVCNSISCPWSETVLFAFPGGSGGQSPLGDLAFDAGGNIYGTTSSGVQYCHPISGLCGNIYELISGNGGWTQQVLYDFKGVDCCDNDLNSPQSGVVLAAGSLYGTAEQYGPAGGVYELTGHSESIIHHFTGPDGSNPIGGLITDGAGHLYGATSTGGPNGGGTVFELNTGGSGFNILYSFSGSEGPVDTLVMDISGNLYGTAYADGAYGYGSVFELSPSSGAWIYTDLHDFTGGSDGANPAGSVAIDANGNLYGTTTSGGSGYGVVWEIMR